jgi:Leucine-rich repeat (LRR) protein
LTNVTISLSKINDLGVEYLGKLNLQRLYIENSTIDSAIINNIQKFTNLTQLSFYNSKLQNDNYKDLIKEIVKIEKLTLLNLGRNSLKNDEVKTIAKLTNLKTLTLNSNCIDLDGIEFLSSLSNLESLNLSANQIGKAAKTLFNLKNLKELQIESCGIDDTALEYLPELIKITSLNLCGNNITDEGINKILDLKSSKIIIYLKGNRTRISPENVNKILLKFSNSYL